MRPQASTGLSADPAADPAAAFAALREAVLDDGPLLHGLRQVAEPESFVARVVAAGAALGLRLDADTVQAAMRADGESGATGAGGTADRSAALAGRLFGWTPFRLGVGRTEGQGAAPALDWCHLDARRMVEPRFAETAARAMREPFNRAFAQRTPLEALAALPQGLPVAGLIVAPEGDAEGHGGATLAAEVLAAFESNIVVAEAQPIAAALGLAPQTCGDRHGEERAAWLAGLVNAYAQQRFTYERRCFVAVPSADAPGIALLRRALPGVPWVLVAAARRCDRRGDEGGGLILDPSELSEALCTTLPAHFGLRLDEGAAAAVRAMAQRHAERRQGR